MNALRRILGILVMIAGILGLVLSIAGLVGLWMAKPTVVNSLTTTIGTLNTTIDTSQQAMEVTKQALGATVDSVDALSTMLASTALSIQDTAPVIQEANLLMGENLPATLNSATDSLRSAQQAAVVLDSSIRSLQAFQLAMSDVPLLSSFVQVPTEAYDPETPLAESLGQVASNLETLPAMLTEMSANMDRADDNLETIQTSLNTMSTSVQVISQSLSEYVSMIGQSQASMENLALMLDNIQSNLVRIVDGAFLVLTLFLLWLLTIQVVVLTQGWELYNGTAGRLEGETPAAQPSA